MSQVAKPEDFEIERMYDFTTFAPSLLGTFKGVRINGIVDWTIAQNIIDPAAMHANIYGALPSNSAPDDYRRYSYLILQHPSNQTMAIGVPWVDANSIEKREKNKVHVTIEDVGSSDMSKIKSALQSNGFEVATIEFAD